MIIREMLPEHIGGVKELLDTCFGKGAWSKDTIRSQMEKSDSCCTVAVEGDRVVGYLAFEQIADEGSIVEIAVHPDFRRRGIARYLINAALDHSDGLAVIFLEVRESNIPAVMLYGSLGFERVGVRRDYYDDPKENAIIMRKKYENTCNREQL